MIEFLVVIILIPIAVYALMMMLYVVAENFDKIIWFIIGIIAAIALLRAIGG